jgi:hypothetical protein
MAEEKLFILAFISSRILSLTTSFALMSLFILNCYMTYSLKVGCFTELPSFLPWLLFFPVVSVMDLQAVETETLAFY